MVRVPGGTVEMGGTFGDGEVGAMPEYTVAVAPFEMMTREVTFAEFDRFADATGIARPDSGAFGRGDRAVVGVTWDEANAFCAWIGARLPTEAEWQWAAQGGPADQPFAGTDSAGAVTRYARYEDNTRVFATRGVTREPNPFGLYDMSGNAYEWVSTYAEFLPDAVEPHGVDLDETPKRVIRGGSFRSRAAHLQTHWRASTLRDVRSDMIGFRCARDAG